CFPTYRSVFITAARYWPDGRGRQGGFPQQWASPGKPESGHAPGRAAA
ncbi:MAG: hypothetical protein AVDCRST_MAG55-3067, partial [uncultured Rubrobacteraceae bacterium]